jgi:hypothetical protein
LEQAFLAASKEMQIEMEMAVQEKKMQERFDGEKSSKTRRLI